MPNQNTPHIKAQKEQILQLKDRHNNIIMEIGSTEYTLRDSSGKMTKRHTNVSFQLTSGELWNPTLIQKYPIGVCEECRKKKKSHGICSLQRSKICTDCGILLCPSCRKLGKDNKWRCKKHHKLHLLKQLISPLFFSEED